MSTLELYCDIEPVERKLLVPVLLFLDLVFVDNTAVSGNAEVLVDLQADVGDLEIVDAVVAFLDTVGSLTAVGKLVEAILLEESFD
jgi:hypothetical protein